MNSLPKTDSPYVAVVGSGYWGKNLIRNYHQIGALKIICDRDDTLLESYQKQYPHIETISNYSEVLNRKDIQGIVIATPAETHFTLAQEALLSGKHVYVEKPLVLNEDDARELIRLAEKTDRILMVGHLLQYHPAFIHLKQLVQDGELGRINYIYSNRLNLGKIRREENILWSFAPHDISMILSLAGESPEYVYASGGNYLHKKIADVTMTHLEFSSGLRAHIFVSWLHPYKEQKLVVVGDKKMAVFNDTEPWQDKLLLYPHRINWEKNIPIADKKEAERVQTQESEPLLNECKHFLDCVRNGHRPITDGKEGLRVLEILNASQASLDQNARKIKLSGAKADQENKTTYNANEYFFHETAVIDNNVTVGNGTKIWHFSHVLSGSTIGKTCNIGQNVVIGPDVTIGDQCKIQNNVSVFKGVTLEDGVFCGPSMVFTNVYNPRSEIRKMDQIRPTMVRKGATIGANATIMCGITLGSYCFIGAGALVNKDVPKHALMVGNPAKQIGWMCACGERLDENFKCTACHRRYQQTNGMVGEK
jgi:UDP-2-acetamido-3-amino-2,3-dideoxy-glucuronate N-acetyltransferase